jgi:hypothetical protein
LTLSSTDYRWVFVPVGGAAPRDEGSAQCRR